MYGCSHVINLRLSSRDSAVKTNHFLEEDLKHTNSLVVENITVPFYDYLPKKTYIMLQC